MLRIRAKSSTGISSDTMMMMPPIVGTPFFSTPNGSTAGSRSVSKIFLRRMNLMKYSPNHAEMSSAKINANSERNEMYDQRCAPETPNCSKYLNT